VSNDSVSDVLTGAIIAKMLALFPSPVAPAEVQNVPSRTDRRAIRRRRCEPLIPTRKGRDGAYPPGARRFDKERCKRRNVVERLIGRLKEFRRIATRYDKLAENFRAFVLLGLIRIWTQNLLLDTA